jgi:RNA polymerase sigma-70 factor (sigma-E family)
MAAEAAVVEIDRGRLAELYMLHAPDALRFAYLLTGDRALAEDLVQDAFARLVGRLVHLRRGEAFPAYLRQTVLNLSRMHFRHRRVERAYLERQGRTRPADATASGIDVQWDLWSAVQQLPERQRAAIVLRYYEDLSEREIADALRCRPGTVRSLLSRGMQALRAAIRGDI